MEQIQYVNSSQGSRKLAGSIGIVRELSQIQLMANGAVLDVVSRDAGKLKEPKKQKGLSHHKKLQMIAATGVKYVIHFAQPSPLYSQWQSLLAEPMGITAPISAPLGTVPPSASPATPMPVVPSSKLSVGAETEEHAVKTHLALDTRLQQAYDYLVTFRRFLTVSQFSALFLDFPSWSSESVEVSLSFSHVTAPPLPTATVYDSRISAHALRTPNVTVPKELSSFQDGSLADWSSVAGLELLTTADTSNELSFEIKQQVVEHSTYQASQKEWVFESPDWVFTPEVIPPTSTQVEDIRPGVVPKKGTFDRLISIISSIDFLIEGGLALLKSLQLRDTLELIAEKASKMRSYFAQQEASSLKLPKSSREAVATAILPRVVAKLDRFLQLFQQYKDFVND